MANSKLPDHEWVPNRRDGEGKQNPKGYPSDSIADRVRIKEKIKATLNTERELHLEIFINNTVKELTKLLLSKHRDYGPKNISQSPGGAINGLRVRMHDKLARINNLIDSNSSPQHESLEDSFKDMANYAIIGLLVLRKQWDNDSNSNER